MKCKIQIVCSVLYTFIAVSFPYYDKLCLEYAKRYYNMTPYVILNILSPVVIGVILCLINITHLSKKYAAGLLIVNALGAVLIWSLILGTISIYNLLIIGSTIPHLLLKREW